MNGSDTDAAARGVRGDKRSTKDATLTVRSEFGWAVVDVDCSGNGPRLRIFAPRTGRSVSLDPLEVESLTQWRHDELVGLVLGREYGPGLESAADRDHIPDRPADSTGTSCVAADRRATDGGSGQ